MNKEKCGFRDETISRWHRTIGSKAPATDLDAIICSGGIVDDGTSDGLRLLEYDLGEPVALIDYKHERANIDFSNSTIQAQATLATMAGLPSFVVKYAADTSWFQVWPTNTKARKIAPNGITVNEEYFTRFLYMLRGRTVPDDVLQRVRTKEVKLA